MLRSEKETAIGLNKIMDELPYILRSLGSQSGIHESGTVNLFNQVYEVHEKPEDLVELKKDFFSLLWFTYRKNFFRLNPTGSSVTSDSGWGCMLRTAQMMLAETLQRHLGPDFRLDATLSDERHIVDLSPKRRLNHTNLITWFGDDPNYMNSFGLHRMCQYGARYGLNVGEWYGPNTVCQVLRDIVNDHDKIELVAPLQKPINVYFSDDSTIYRDEVGKATSNWESALLILLPVRLGLDGVPQEQRHCIKALMASKYSVGIVGGKPRSSLYFVGTQNNSLLYLDPHTVQTKVQMDISASPEHMSKVDIETYHCTTLKLLDFDNLDPSMAFGFYIPDKAAFDKFQREIIDIQLLNAIILVQDTRPVYNLEDSSFDLGESNGDEDEFVVL